ncbi:ISP domain-containing protein [Polychaeton citri CBS 116435]|uniref:ISP domain-containing protein n=1 Tax=Polychaeton citri CBS 116435 TaxID=1314669 RepID=A0A9P4Q9C0_9PEZI|nr:ISP domain-containing protein [Polychaeton citri CBS 116435]
MGLLQMLQLNLGSHVPHLISFAFLIGGWYIISNFSVWLEKCTSLASPLVYGKAKKQTPKAQLYPCVIRESDFPDGWWTSKTLYTLEKRAIFSKTWLFVCHASLFQRPGDYRTFDIADFNIIVMLSKDGVIRAFHNVCRHRAYSVCTKSAGNALALRCRYHGWTYDSRGKLVKAPKFDDVVGFDKSQNSLFEVRTFIDTSGFIYVNLDAYGSDGLTIRVGMPIKARLDILETWTVEAKINWKFGLCPGAFELQSLTSKRRLARLFNSASALVEYWSWPAEFELSPLTRMIRTGYGNHWLTISVLPIDEDRSRLKRSPPSIEVAGNERGMQDC